MNQTIKNVGLLAIIPLALVVLSPILIDDVNATNVGSQDVIGRPGYQPDKVCGDRLCSGDNGPNIGTQNGIGRLGYQPDKVCGDKLCSENSNFPTYANRFSSSSTIALEFDALSFQVAEKTQELTIANANGDFDKVSELQEELKILKNLLAELKGK